MAFTNGKIPKATGDNVLEDGYAVETTVGDPGADTAVVTEQGVREALTANAWDGDIADIDLDGGADIGAALADGDLILVDDGAGGTNRKSAVSRLATYIGGAVKLDDLAAPEDNTDLDASASAHGLLPKLSGDATQVLLGGGSWGSLAHANLSGIGTSDHHTKYTDAEAVSALEGNANTFAAAQTFDEDAVFNKAARFDAVYDNGNSGAAATINLTNGNKQKITLTDDATITLSDPSSACLLTLMIYQDGTGGRSLAWSTTGSLYWAESSEPDWTTAAGGWDIVFLLFDGTDWHGGANLNFG